MSNEISLIIRRVGAMGFDLVIRVDENPALQDSAMEKLDTLLSSPNNSAWISNVFPWSVAYTVGRSYRHISADVKSMEGLLNAWIKSCAQQYGKNLRVEK
jgi:hypothetical protein